MLETIGKEYFTKGYNCSQSVVLAFKDKLNIPERELAMLASSFGGGFARLREVCGAVSGMFIVAGLLKGYSMPTDVEGKKRHYELCQQMAEEFRRESGSIICRDLLQGNVSSTPEPTARTEEFYKKRPCVELVGIAVRVAEKFLL